MPRSPARQEGNHVRSLKDQSRRPDARKTRAEKKADMHRELARAAFELHESIGPSKTTVSAIARKAGVQRLTVYRHFSDEEEVFSACTAYSFEIDPPPSPDHWAAITDPEERLRTALGQLFGYYARKQQLLSNLYRDAEMPVVNAALERRRAVMNQAVNLLAQGWPAASVTNLRLRAAVGHAIEFSTWLSLTKDQGLNDDEAMGLAFAFVTAVAIKHT
jgi:AcrR family transcriptional regulator